VLFGESQGYTDFLVSNESSSDESNLVWKGYEINHQWTKTTDFEQRFNQMLELQGISFRYASVLRPLNELLISGVFGTKLSKYFSTFFSCNKSKTLPDGTEMRWCGKCAKCASSTLLLSPFIDHSRLVEIIGTDMLADTSYTDLFAELSGLSGNKPFECVCSIEEATLIVHILSKKDDYRALPVVSSLAAMLDESMINSAAESVLAIREKPANLDQDLYDIVARNGSDIVDLIKRQLS
jgi:hypothetical protein